MLNNFFLYELVKGQMFTHKYLDTEIIGLIIYLLTELIYNEHYGRKLKLVHLFSYSNVVPK